ncbi:hypothetical protein LBWT_X1770 (plasmid) [Leptolyngbya boryana IAM M-101]|nr:hypothetical protein LBWT_X1770 [Leptolyngbya boryana IAM M-101]BAS66453.1 hypothetical protein LBDG_X1770 [Leptolyngbya boryana dg5]
MTERLIPPFDDHRIKFAGKLPLPRSLLRAYEVEANNAI